MKVFKRIVIWITISLIVQFSGFYYINNKFLTLEGNIKSEKVEENEETVKAKKIELPSNVENLALSYDGKYISYIEGKSLMITDAATKKEKKVEVNNNGANINYYKWLPDRDRLLLVEKQEDYDGVQLELYSYDVKKNEKSKIKDFQFYGDVNVKDIQLSILTGVTCIRLEDSDKVSSIYRINRMGETNKINTVPKHISNMTLLRRDDILVYEGEVYNAIYTSRDQNELEVEGCNRLTVLGSDDDKNIYVGSLKDGLVTKIFYRDVTNNEEEWQEIKLDKPTKNKDIFICNDGSVYINDTNAKTITEQKTMRSLYYDGELFQFGDEGIFIKKGNVVEFINYN